MTEKQYTIVNMGLDGQYIKENGKIMTIERVVDLLNENEQLKDKYNEQSVQYEGLEEQVERLLDFRDNVFDLINKKIDKLKNINEVSLIPRESVEILKELKKELLK